MKKIKNMVKKGGIADIVTLMVIVGLVIALIIAVVLPMVNRTEEVQNSADTNLTSIEDEISDLSGN